MVKRIVLLCMIMIVGFLLNKAVFAASSDTLAITVTVSSTLGVSISESTIDFGSVGIGTTTQSTSGVTITNTGSGINETYELSLTNPSGWIASQTVADTDIYVLNAAFDGDGTGITWAEASHALSTTPMSSSLTKFAGDQNGLNVPYNETRELWFQFKSPTQSSVATQQTITLTVTAVAS